MITCKFEDGKDVLLRHTTVDNVVLDEQGRILLVKRNAKMNEGGKWCLPGGFADRDESILEAAKREVLEETGWTVKKQQLLMIIDSPVRGDQDRQNVTFLFYAMVSEKIGTPDWESDEARFYTFDQLPPDNEIAFDHLKLIEIYQEITSRNLSTPLLSSTSGLY